MIKMRSRLRLFRGAGARTASLVILLAVAGLVLAAPLICRYSYKEQDLEKAFRPPSFGHLMGTDMKGRDLFARVLYGGRVSLAVGLTATAVSLAIGVTYGLVAGFAGGKLDNAMMRFVDVLYSLPYMFFVILLVTFVGRSLINLFIALGAVQWLTMARIVRGQILVLKEQEFVEAARAVGAAPSRIVFRHLLPNVVGPVIVCATLTVPSVMLQEAFLSFLGLGVQPPACSWGSLMANGAAAINPVQTNWWLVAFPGLALSLTLLAMNFLGDGLRDTLDPATTARR